MAMQRISVSGLFSLIFAFATLGAAAVDRVRDFALLDHQGKFHQLSYYGDQQALVIAVHDGSDAQSPAELVKIQSDMMDQSVMIFMLNANKDQTRESIARQAAAFAIPVLIDESQLVARDLGFTRIGEAIVIDPETMQIVFRAAVGDELGAAVNALVNDQAVAPSSSQLAGSMIDYDELRPGDKVSYKNDIVPMLTENCVSCHHDGGIGPWSMSSHAMIQGWSPMMREVVMTRRMPPGQVDPHVGKPIEDVAGLTDHEKQLLVSWIDAGAPKDGGEDPLAGLKFSNPKFTLGEPDLVYKVPPQSIPATGVLDYRYVPVDLNLDRDVWIRAMEFVPGDRQVLHHVIAYASSPADKKVRGRETGAGQGDNIGGFAPGRQPDVFRDNSGRLLKKGSSLLLQMHYTTSGKETVDETEFAIYLHDKPPKYVMGGGVAGQRRFLVPPRVKEHKLEGEMLIERDAYLYEMQPHMHFRGKYMSYWAAYPDGREEILLSVPKYDFNWQFNYLLEEPVFLPAGTRLIARGAMDNSDRNPGNPDPSKPVHFGLQTKHEMFFGFVTLRYVGDTPESIVSNEPAKMEDATPGR
jgi:hypothetical protein